MCSKATLAEGKTFFKSKRMWTTDSHYVVGAQPLGNKASYMIKLILVSEILYLSGLIIKYKYTFSQHPKHVQLRGFSIDHKSLKIAQIKKIKTLCVSKSIIFFWNIFSKNKISDFFSPKVFVLPKRTVAIWDAWSNLQ